MTVTPLEKAARITFEVPGGELRFGDGDLDLWAEHLAWCYDLIGVKPGSTIAVQDFGTSPLAYLGSSLLMPTLDEGVAERIDAKVICLDASAERVVLTPDVMRQVMPDVLIVRADVLGLLLDGSRRAGVDLTTLDGLDIVVAIGAEAVPLPPGRHRRLLHVESCLLLAPECTACGHFHLRDGHYELEDGVVTNLKLDGVEARALPRLAALDAAVCSRGPHDTLFDVDEGGRS